MLTPQQVINIAHRQGLVQWTTSGVVEQLFVPGLYPRRYREDMQGRRVMPWGQRKRALLSVARALSAQERGSVVAARSLLGNGSFHYLMPVRQYYCREIHPREPVAVGHLLPFRRAS